MDARKTDISRQNLLHAKTRKLIEQNYKKRSV